MDTDVLSTVRSSLTVRTQESAAVQRRLQQELMESERKCESGSGVLPVATLSGASGHACEAATDLRAASGGRTLAAAQAGERA